MSKWKKVKLGEILTESRIVSTNPDPQKRIRVKLNIGGVEKRPETNEIAGGTKYFKRTAGQFIYGQQNLHKGAFGIVPLELDGYESSSDIPAFDVDDSCFPEWIYYFFKQGNFYLKLEPLAKGVGSKRIYPSQIFNLTIVLPSKDEQKDVLDSIAIFENNYSKLTNEVNHQITLVAKLKDAVLQEAVSGKLSLEWRNKNKNATTSKALIEKIDREKKEANELKSNRFKFYSQIRKSEIQSALPASWMWTRLGNVIELISGQHINTEDYNDKGNGVPYLTGPSDFGQENPVFSKWSMKPKVLAKKNDILITVKGSGVGKLNVLHVDDVAIGRQLMAVRSNWLNMGYIKIFLESNYAVLQSQKIGVAIPGISRDDILLKLFPLPSSNEQEFIVKKVNALNKFISQLEIRIEQSITNSNLLIQSYLNEIFGDENKEMLKRIDQKKETLFDIKDLSNYGIAELEGINYSQKLTDMELIELLKENGKMTAVDLWRMSKYSKSIDAFYEELKRQVEEKKTIKESKEKGFLELTR